MAIKSVKLKESMSMSDLLALVEERWDEEKYGKASLMSIHDKPLIGVEADPWYMVVFYTQRKKVCVQPLPHYSQMTVTREGQQSLKKVNKEILPHIYQGVEEILYDRKK